MSEQNDRELTITRFSQSLSVWIGQCVSKKDPLFEDDLSDMVNTLEVGLSWLPEVTRARLLKAIQVARAHPNTWPSLELGKWHTESGVQTYVEPSQFRSKEPLSLLLFSRSERATSEFCMQLTRFTSEVYRSWLPAVPVTEWFVQGHSTQDSYITYMSVFNRLVLWVQESVHELEESERINLAEFWVVVTSVCDCY